MATYKLIQDIEAEDHILGPLTLRQFIFALIAVFCFYICFIAIAKHFTFLLIPFLPPGLFFAFFAFPFGRDQPTEVWALAKIRFLIKPRRRIWDQTGIKELVTITAPKKVEPVRTNGLSPVEVDSRLKALANTLDSRGWAVKNVNVSDYAQPGFLAPQSDRLIDASSLPQEVASVDVQAADDIMDATNNPIARQFDHMIAASEQAHRQQLLDQVNASAAAAPAAQPPADYWFMNQPAVPTNLPAGQAMFSAGAPVQPGVPVSATLPTAEEQALSAQLKQSGDHGRNSANAHLRTLQPLGSTPAAPVAAVPQAPPPSSAATPDPAILSLANNNDLDVATLERQAAKQKGRGDLPHDEVVISLH